MSRSEKRMIQLFAFLAAWGLVVIARLVQVQVVRHDEYTQKAVRQQERTLSLAPVRGSIVDARLRVLAESVAAESVCADPQSIQDPRATARALAAIRELGVDARDVEQRLRGGGSFVYIARRVPLDVSASVRKLNLPGLFFVEEHRRSYPRQTLAASVVGYVGMDGEGLGGIEHSFDRYVRGRAGKVTLVQDARRGMYVLGGEGANKAVDGDTVVLTIDEVVQFIAERALQRQVEKYHATGGSLIVMDPTDGAILAMASSPTFDPNRYNASAATDWKNRGVQDLYEPGSTFKIVTASAGLEEGVVTPSQVLDCGEGKIAIGGVEIHEHGNNKYGLLTFEDVMVHSSNVGAIRVGLALGPQRFYDYIRRFGFGERTGIPLPGEGVGILRHTQKWSALSNATMSIGQEIGATPLQVIRAFATVANGGIRVEPHIVDRVIDANGNVIYGPPPAAPVRVISEKTAAVLNEILKQVVVRGTGQNAALVDQVVAGKTGTAQKADRGRYSVDKVVASFGGYVPADRPRLVILVVIDEPHGAQYGGTVAAPAFHEVAEGALRYLGVAPSLPSRRIGIGAPVLATISQKWPAGTSAFHGGRETPRNQAAAAAPDLRGLDARTAVATAVRQGLIVQAIGSGVVTGQVPEAGGIVPADRRIALSFSPRPESK